MLNHMIHMMGMLLENGYSEAPNGYINHEFRNFPPSHILDDSHSLCNEDENIYIIRKAASCPG